MVFIHTLRMMADLSVYFFIAELFTAFQGRPSQFIHFLLLSFCYGILVALQNKNFNKIYVLLPAVVFLLPGSYHLALIPPVIYILYLIYNRHTALSWDRQSELFSAAVKFYPAVGIVACIVGSYAAFVQYALPVVFVSLTSSVFLMRMLRQPPSVYLDQRYQRRNFLVFLVVMGFAWLFSRDFVFNLAGYALSFVYTKVIYPVLNGFVWVFMGILQIFIYIFSWFKFGEIKFEENHLTGGNMGPSFKDMVVTGDRVAVTEFVFTAAIVAVLFATAFFFFRWLVLHNGEESFINRSIDIIRGKDSAKPRKERATTTALQIRRQYRVFLRLYKDSGGRIETSSTSEDVLQHSVEILPNVSADILNEMRQIYIDARYGGIATKADLKRMKQINKELSIKN